MEGRAHLGGPWRGWAGLHPDYGAGYTNPRLGPNGGELPHTRRARGTETGCADADVTASGGATIGGAGRGPHGTLCAQVAFRESIRVIKGKSKKRKRCHMTFELIHMQVPINGLGTVLPA